MNIFAWLKGVVNRMLGRTDIENAIHVTPVVSDEMRDAIELWENMYKNKSPWLSDTVHSLGLASLIASEKARMATLEMEIKITGETARSEFLEESFKEVQKTIRQQLEYGIALGGLVIKPYVVMGPKGKYKIKFTYTKASSFYPLSFSADGKLTAAAFIDRIISGEKIYSKLEIHVLQSNRVKIENRAFVTDTKTDARELTKSGILGRELSLTSIPEWADIEPAVELNDVDTLMFAYFKNPEANTVDVDSPLGTSGYSRVTKLIREADEQYSNLLWEFEGGQMAIDIDRTALIPVVDKNGRAKEPILPKLQDRLYRRELDLGTDNWYNVFAPSLRDDSLINGLNNILMHIEDACSLARGTISEVNVSEARTATELKILKQRAYAANADIQKELQDVFDQLFRVMDIYCDLYDIVPDGDYEVSYKWDDSILVDKDAERQIDIIDVNNGLMSKLEYRIKWFGETEAQAKKSLGLIAQEQKESLQLTQQFSPTTESQDTLNSTNRAIDSDEPNTVEDK